VDSSSSFDVADDIGGGFRAHALQRRQVFGPQIVEVGHALDYSAVHQLIHQRIAHAVDIHDGARGEVQHRFLQPRGAVGVMQRVAASPSSRTTLPPHTGQAAGMRNFLRRGP